MFFCISLNNQVQVTLFVPVGRFVFAAKIEEDIHTDKYRTMKHEQGQTNQKHDREN